MKLTKVERLILSNQYKILSKIDPDSDFYEANIEILNSGYEYEYYTLFGEINEDSVPTEICEETIAILSMFRRFSNQLRVLSEDKKNELGSSLEKMKFQGFDANNDSHYFYTKFMIERLGKWDELKNMYLNSHSSSTITIYRNMLKVYHELGLKKKNKFTFEDIKLFLDKI